MLTKEQVIEALRSGRKSDCLDGRDYARLAEFFPVEMLPEFGLTLKEGAEWTVKEYTRENVLDQLREDIAFGFEKALGRRGISSSFMHSTVLMWMWLLEDELQSHSSYAQYGLPLFKAVAVKYGFDNPIGNDTGSEHKYSEYAR